MKISKETGLYFSFAQNPGTSGSTLYNYFFKKHDINALYIPRYAVAPQEVITSIKSLNAKGVSVSSPLKQVIMPFLNELSDEAKIISSVNTIVNSNGILKGHNTDAWGIWKCLEPLSLKNVLIYGSGGVIPSVVWALKKKGLNAKNIFLHARNSLKAKTSAQSLGIEEFSSSAGKLSFELIINATPAPLSSITDLKRLSYEKEFQLSVGPEQSHSSFISGNEMYQYVFQKQYEIYTGIQISLDEILSVPRP